MNIGSTIQHIRRECGLTQEAFGDLFHVTRQAVSSWETGKTYPDLQILVEISNRFDISLDTLLKADAKLVQSIDRQRQLGAIRRGKALADRCAGAGTGIVVSCLFSTRSAIRMVMILTGLILICVGWYIKARYDQRMLSYLEEAC